MLDKLKKFYSELIKKDFFLDWKKNHEDAYLSSIFNIDYQNWQIAFYDPKTDLVTTFLKDKIMQEDSEVYKKENDKVENLKLEDVKIDLDEAEKSADKLLKEKYKEQTKSKLLILQHRRLPIWNLSNVTTSFKVINVKINALTGEIIHDEIVNLIS